MASQSNVLVLSPIQRTSLGIALIYGQFYLATRHALSIFDVDSEMADKITSGTADKKKFTELCQNLLFSNLTLFFESGVIFKNADKKTVVQLKEKFGSLNQQCGTFIKANKASLKIIGIDEKEKEARQCYDNMAKEFSKACLKFVSSFDLLLKNDLFCKDVDEATTTATLQTICSDTLHNVKNLLESFENIVEVLNPSFKKTNITLEDFTKLDLLSLYKKLLEYQRNFTDIFSTHLDSVDNDFFAKAENITRYDELCTLIERSKTILNSIGEFEKQLNPSDIMNENEKDFVNLAKKLCALFFRQGNSFLNMIQNNINKAKPVYETYLQLQNLAAQIAKKL